MTDHRTPFEERWGGWYVTGTHGALRHRGNALARDPTSGAGLVAAANQNLTTLVRFVDPDDYLTPTSDLIALMTLEHQTQMINLFTRARWEARIAEHDGLLNETEAAARRRSVDEIVRYMLFADEAPLSNPIQGVSTFIDRGGRAPPQCRRDRPLHAVCRRGTAQQPDTRCLHLHRDVPDARTARQARPVISDPYQRLGVRATCKSIEASLGGNSSM